MLFTVAGQKQHAVLQFARWPWVMQIPLPFFQRLLRIEIVVPYRIPLLNCARVWERSALRGCVPLDKFRPARIFIEYQLTQHPLPADILKIGVMVSMVKVIEPSAGGGHYGAMTRANPCFASPENRIGSLFPSFPEFPGASHTDSVIAMAVAASTVGIEKIVIPSLFHKDLSLIVSSLPSPGMIGKG